MPELRNNYFMCEELLLDFAMTLGCPWYKMCLLPYSEGQPCNLNQYKYLFSLALVYPFQLMCKTLLFLCQIVQVLEDESEKKNSMV